MRASWIAAPLVALAIAGCTFEGYVPKEKPPPPLAESEANIASLEIGETRSAGLDCTKGSCRVRYRLVVPSPGVLTVTVQGPLGEGPEPTGPRIARVVLEGVGQQTLGTVYGTDLGAPPVVLSSPVTEGIHFVLIQALGGQVDYSVGSSFEPKAGEAEPGESLPKGVVMPAPPPPPPLPSQVKPAGRARTGADRPGNTSDGADFAYDPTRLDLFNMRYYSFAQDPAAMLKGSPGSIQGNAFILRQIQRDVRYVLANMQFNEVPKSEAQFLVSLHTGSQSGRAWYAVNDAIAPRPYDSYFQQWTAAGLTMTAQTYVDGQLVINFIDAKTGALLWHGWTTESIPNTGSDNKAIDQAVKKVLAQY
jgi:hypothetical protein